MGGFHCALKKFRWQPICTLTNHLQCTSMHFWVVFIVKYALVNTFPRSQPPEPQHVWKGDTAAGYEGRHAHMCVWSGVWSRTTNDYVVN